MASRQRTAQLDKTDGKLTVQEHETDSLMLPVAHIERLQSIRPDAVDLILRETEAESKFRRTEEHRVNTLIFIERAAGQIIGAVIGIAGVFGGVYASVNGAPEAGGVIATVSIGTLAVVYVKGRAQP